MQVLTLNLNLAKFEKDCFRNKEINQELGAHGRFFNSYFLRGPAVDRKSKGRRFESCARSIFRNAYFLQVRILREVNFSQCLFLAAVVLTALYGCRFGNP